MKKFPISYVNYQGVILVVVLVDSLFGRMTKIEQTEALVGLQACAQSANLQGAVVAAWREGNRIRFVSLAKLPPAIHSLQWDIIQAHPNGELTCG